MKRILIIVFDMLPFSKTWGGCQRMYYLAEAMQKKGYKVKVLAFRRESFNTYGKQLLEDVVYTEGRNQGETHKEDTYETANVSKCAPWIKNLIYKLDYFLFNEIQKGGGIKSYIKYQKGKKVLKTTLKNDRFDVAVVSCPPFNLFRSISLIKKFSPPTKVIMDYRDPWNSWHANNLLTTLREKRLQRKADIIVCTNNALCEDMSRKFKIKIDSYRAFSNGFIREDVDLRTILTPEIQKGVMNIVYTGAVGFTKQTNDYRNPIVLMDAFEEVVKQGYPIRLVFVGVKNPNGPEIQALKDKLGDHLQIVGIVDNTTALAYVENSDACLLLHTSDDNSGKFLISGKAYDYIQKRKYILSVSNEDSLHARIINENKIGENVVNEVQPIKEMIIRAYTLWRNDALDGVYQNVDVEQYSRAIQIEKYIKLISSL